MEYDITDIAPRPKPPEEWWEKCEMTISKKHYWSLGKDRKCIYCGLVDDIGITK